MNVPNADVRGMERCGSCKKLVYLHRPTVVCSLDGHIYHGSCLGYDIDTCKPHSQYRRLVLLLYVHVLTFFQ